MKIKYLGTAAAEGVPAMFCDCDICRKSREKKGKNIRTRSQAIIDNKILIDFPADTYMHVLKYDMNLFDIKTCIITHDHSDHLYPPDLEMRCKDFAFFAEKPLNFYAPKPAFEKIMSTIHHYNLDVENRVHCKTIKEFVPFEAEGYTITPLAADHDFRCNPVIYIVQHKNKSILYANDTGYFPEKTWEYIKKTNIHFDCISLDCTGGNNPIYYNNHMSLPTCNIVRQRLIDMRKISEDTVCVLNHFSHKSEYTYDEFSALAKENNYITSYDGLTVEF